MMTGLVSTLYLFLVKMRRNTGYTKLVEAKFLMEMNLC